MRFTAPCLLLWISSGLAWAGVLQGTVKDSSGHPIEGAEIRISGKTLTKTVKTDAKGHYTYDGLVAGADYKVSLLVNGSVKASMQDVRLGTGADRKATLLLNGSVKVSVHAVAEKPTELSFDLLPANSSPKKQMVWIPDPATGTHIGASGHWAQVDDNGIIIGNDTTDVVKMGRTYARQLEMGGTRPVHEPSAPVGPPPGH